MDKTRSCVGKFGYDWIGYVLLLFRQAGTFTKLNGPSGSFIFDHPNGEAALRDWISAGPAHHMALTRGRLDVELEVMRELLDMEIIAIGARKPER